LLTRLHRQRERDRRLVEAKKKDALRKHGRLFCEACDLQPELKFGNRGRSVIECHHIRPLHTLVDGDTMRLDDLALICANCHRLIHGGKPWLTLEDLRLSLPGYEQRDDAGDANRVLAHSQHLLDALAVWFANWPVSAGAAVRRARLHGLEPVRPVRPCRDGRPGRAVDGARFLTVRSSG